MVTILLEQVQQKLTQEQQDRDFCYLKEERGGLKKQKLQVIKYILELENILTEHLVKFSSISQKRAQHSRVFLDVLPLLFLKVFNMVFLLKSL